MRVPTKLMHGSVWFFIVVAVLASFGIAEAVLGTVFGYGPLGNVVGAILAILFLVAGVTAWAGAIQHWRTQEVLSRGPRRIWGVVVFAFFVFGALAYYLAVMLRYPQGVGASR